jgi:WD40 repeat protein
MSPSSSPDGRQIYFGSNANGGFDVYVKDVDASSSEQPLGFEKGQNVAMFPTTSRDGRYIAYISEDLATKRFHIHTVALTGDRTPKTFRASSANEIMPASSPDGRWLAVPFRQRAISGLDQQAPNFELVVNWTAGCISRSCQHLLSRLMSGQLLFASRAVNTRLRTRLRTVVGDLRFVANCDVSTRF